jgi:hypothetical protein
MILFKIFKLINNIIIKISTITSISAHINPEIFIKNSNTVWNQRIGHGKAKQILLLLQLARFPDFAHKNLFVSVWKIMDNGFSEKTWLLFNIFFFSVKSMLIFFSKYIPLFELYRNVNQIPTLQSTCSILVQLFVKKMSFIWSFKKVTCTIFLHFFH